MSENKIMDRVAKLLALSKSDNVNEAAAALRAAQKLMTEHNINEAMLSQDFEEALGDIEESVLHKNGTRLITWKSCLANGLAQVNQCKVFNVPATGEIRIVGHTKNVATVNYMFNYIYREIDRLCVVAKAIRGPVTKTWTNNFRIGATMAVIDNLEAADKEAKIEAQAKATGTDIICVNRALAKMEETKKEVEDWAQARHTFKERPSVKIHTDREARAAGYQAGKTIHTGRSAGGLGSGSTGALKP